MIDTGFIHHLLTIFGIAQCYMLISVIALGWIVSTNNHVTQKEKCLKWAFVVYLVGVICCFLYLYSYGFLQPPLQLLSRIGLGAGILSVCLSIYGRGKAKVSMIISCVVLTLYWLAN